MHNFVNRSSRLNFEVMAVVVDKAFAIEIELMFNDDFQHAESIDPKD